MLCHTGGWGAFGGVPVSESWSPRGGDSHAAVSGSRQTLTTYTGGQALLRRSMRPLAPWLELPGQQQSGHTTGLFTAQLNQSHGNR